jgi:hypothetical protein
MIAPLLFLAGLAVALPVSWPFGKYTACLVGPAAILMGILALRAFLHWGWGAACLPGAIVAFAVGYVAMGKSLYVPGLALLLVEPALLAWYFRRPLVMPVRI